MRSFHSGHFRFLNWNNDCSEGWRERGEDATKWPQRPCIFLECCLSYLEQPSIIVSCPFWHFLCPQSTPALHHTLCVFVFACVFPCTQIHVCIYTHKYTYVNTQERPAPRHSPGVTFRNYHFSRVLFFSLLICMSYSWSQSFGSSYNDLLLYSLFPARVTNESKWSVAVITSATLFINQTISGDSWPRCFSSSLPGHSPVRRCLLKGFLEIWVRGADKWFSRFHCDILNSDHNVGMFRSRTQ